MSKKLVTPELAEEIARMREEVDGWGDRKWSCAAIAAKLGLSESTVWRVDTKRAAYAGKNHVSEGKRDEARWAALGAGTLPVTVASVDDAAIAASLARLNGMLGGAVAKLEVSPEVRAKAAALLGRGE